METELIAEYILQWKQVFRALPLKFNGDKIAVREDFLKEVTTASNYNEKEILDAVSLFVHEAKLALIKPHKENE